MIALMLTLSPSHAAETVHLYFKEGVTTKTVLASTQSVEVATFTFQKKAGSVRK